MRKYFLALVVALFATSLAAQEIVGNQLAVPGGSSGQVQYNSSGLFAGMTGSTWDDTNGSLTLGGATDTTSHPVLNLSQTWNAGAVTFAGIFLNITDTASSATSKFLDLQKASVSQLSIDKVGDLITLGTIRATTGTAAAVSIGIDATRGIFSAGGGTLNFVAGVDIFNIQNVVNSMGLGSTVKFGWTSASDPAIAQPDTILTRAAAATIQQGSVDVAAPVAQTTQVQSVVAGTSNTAGANWTLTGSKGTGTGAGGAIIFSAAPAGTTGTAQNAAASVFSVNPEGVIQFRKGFIVSTLPAAGTVGRMSYVTDAVTCTLLGALTGSGSTVCPVFDNGTAWVGG